MLTADYEYWLNEDIVCCIIDDRHSINDMPVLFYLSLEKPHIYKITLQYNYNMKPILIEIATTEQHSSCEITGFTRIDDITKITNYLPHINESIIPHIQYVETHISKLLPCYFGI